MGLDVWCFGGGLICEMGKKMELGQVMIVGPVGFGLGVWVAELDPRDVPHGKFYYKLLEVKFWTKVGQIKNCEDKLGTKLI